jgi:hypothetical protein
MFPQLGELSGFPVAILTLGGVVFAMPIARPHGKRAGIIKTSPADYSAA